MFNVSGTLWIRCYKNHIYRSNKEFIKQYIKYYNYHQFYLHQNPKILNNNNYEPRLPTIYEYHTTQFQEIYWQPTFEK